MTQELNLQLVVRAATQAAVTAIRQLNEETRGIGTTGREAGRAATAGLGTVPPVAVTLSRTARDAAVSITTVGQAGVQAGRAAASGLGEVQRVAVRTSRAVAESTSGIRDQLGGLQAALAGALSVRAIVGAADTFSQLEGRLRLVTEGTAEYTQRSRELFGIAQQNGQSLEATVSLYARTAGAVRDLTGNSRDAVSFTRLVGQAFRISGASAAEASGATLQLSQALQSGVLRGDEFNSVNEQGGRLIQALADGLGVARGALRQMAEAGELTSDRVLPALLSQMQRINEEAAQLPQTIGQSLTRLGNAFIVATDSAAGLQGALVGIRTVLDGLSASPRALGVLIDVAAVGAAAAVFGRLAAAVGGARLALAGLVSFFGGPVVAGIAGVTAVGLTLVDLFRDRTPRAVEGTIDAVDELVASYERLNVAQSQVERSPLTSDQSAGVRATGARIAQLNQALSAARATPGVSESDPVVTGLNAEIARLTAVVQGVATSANQRAAAPANAALSAFNDKFEDEGARTERNLAEYRRLIREAGRQEDPAVIQRILAGGGASAPKARDVRESETERQSLILRLTQDRLTAQGRLEEAAFVELAQRTIRNFDAAANDPQAQSLVKALFDVDFASLRRQQIEREAEALGRVAGEVRQGFDGRAGAASERFSQRRANVEVQSEAGTLSQLGARRELRAAAADFEAEISAIRASLTTGPSILSDEQTVGVLANLESLRAGIGSFRGPIEQLLLDWQDTTAGLEQATAGFLDGAADGIARFVATGRLSFRGLLQSFAQDIARSGIRSLLANLLGGGGGGGLLGFLVSGASSLLSGAAGGAGASAGGLIGAGGIGGQFTTPIAIPSTGFASGGVIEGPGSGTSDSILARVSNGEFIVRADVVRRLGVGFLNSLNSGRVPGFNAGGSVRTAGIVPLNAGGSGSFATTPVVVNQSFDFSGRSAQDIAALQAFGQRIKQETMAATFDALRRRTANL